MSNRISATYVDGVLKLDAALELPDRARVNVVIESVAESRDAKTAWNMMKDRLRRKPIHGAWHYSRDDLHERS